MKCFDKIFALWWQRENLKLQKFSFKQHDKDETCTKIIKIIILSPAQQIFYDF